MDREFPEFFKTHLTFISRLFFKASWSLWTKAQVLLTGAVHVDAGRWVWWMGKDIYSHTFFIKALFTSIEFTKQSITQKEWINMFLEKLYAYWEALKQINWQIVSPKMASANGAFFKASLFYAKQQSKEQLKGNVTLHIVIYKRSSLYKI